MRPKISYAPFGGARNIWIRLYGYGLCVTYEKVTTTDLSVNRQHGKHTEYSPDA